MGCCDSVDPNLEDPNAPEFQKPYNQIPTCPDGCGGVGVWVDIPPRTPLEIKTNVIISKLTR